MSEWAEAIYLYVQSLNVQDKECNCKLPLHLHCNKLMCEFCFNTHMKYQHAAEYLYVSYGGNMVETKLCYYPDAVLEVLISPFKRSEDASFIDQLSDAELSRLYSALKVQG